MIHDSWTYQGLAQKFKDFSRLCEPCIELLFKSNLFVRSFAFYLSICFIGFYKTKFGIMCEFSLWPLLGVKGWWFPSPSMQVNKGLWIDNRRQNFATITWDGVYFAEKKTKTKTKQSAPSLHPPRPHFKLSWMLRPLCSLNSGTTLLRGVGEGKRHLF